MRPDDFGLVETIDGLSQSVGALSPTAGVAGSFLGGVMMGIYLSVRWSYFPFGASHPDPLLKTMGAIPLIAVLAGTIGAMLAVPLALMVGPAVVLFLYGPLRSHFALSTALITIAFAALGAAVAVWLNLGAGMEMPGAFVSSGVALTLCWLTRKHVEAEMDW